MKQTAKAGFKYLVEVIGADGFVRDREVIHNLMPVEGLNHLLGVALKSSAQVATWYVGLYEGNYTPVPGDTAAGFPTSATETTAYDETTRQVLTLGAVLSGAVDNSANRAQFTLNATKTIYGGFISSSSAKSSTSGVLLSAVKFSSPKSLESGEILRLTAGFTITSI
jgi:hypothetical protein